MKLHFPLFLLGDLAVKRSDFQPVNPTSGAALELFKLGLLDAEAQRLVGGKNPTVLVGGNGCFQK